MSWFKTDEKKVAEKVTAELKETFLAYAEEQSEKQNKATAELLSKLGEIGEKNSTAMTDTFVKTVDVVNSSIRDVATVVGDNSKAQQDRMISLMNAQERQIELLIDVQRKQSESVSSSVQNMVVAAKESIAKQVEVKANEWTSFEQAQGHALIVAEDFKNKPKVERERILAQINSCIIPANAEVSKRFEQSFDVMQKKAACALNMCMVSLSQIVDYNDINVMRQEYDTILNNLNLEQVIKDEALLTAFKKILDTCHFYILHAKDKEVLKKKQAARLKGAFGKAVGGGGIVAIFGNPNPYAVAAGALALIGTMAVRYKTERDKAKLENEVEEWELEKSALEQLHNLKHTLFDTAWRLATEYGFPDKYRLTEKQIAIYNEILLDPDPLSRYERLYLIKDSFEAYPLFWYYLGRAALETAFAYMPQAYVENGGCFQGLKLDDLNKSDKSFVRYETNREDLFKHYLGKAQDAYEGEFEDGMQERKGGFINAQKGNGLLREDVLIATAYLDCSEFHRDDYEKTFEYTEKARELAGMNLELLQQCAIRYLQVYDGAQRERKQKLAEEAFKQAEWTLRLLTNEGFDLGEDEVVNGKLLSCLYVQRKTKGTKEDQKENKAKYDAFYASVTHNHPFAFDWMLPWDANFCREEILAYIVRGGLVETIFRYFYGRIKRTYIDFYQALHDALKTKDLSPIRVLKEKATIAELDKEGHVQYERDGSEKKTKAKWAEGYEETNIDEMVSEDTAIWRLRKEFWFEGVETVENLKALKEKEIAKLNALKADPSEAKEITKALAKLDDLEFQLKTRERDEMPDAFGKILNKCKGVKSCTDEESMLIKKIKTFIQDSSERKWYTGFLWRHAVDFDAPYVKFCSDSIEESLISFVKEVTNEFHKELIAYTTDLTKGLQEDFFVAVKGIQNVSVLDKKKEAPFFKVISYLEKELDKYAKELSPITVGPRFRYPEIDFKKENHEK